MIAQLFATLPFEYAGINHFTQAPLELKVY